MDSPLPLVRLTKVEHATLARHGLAVYRGKVILEAQPPITDAELARIEQMVGWPLPEGLVDLWRTSFGGRLDYDLAVAIGDHRYAVSFTELFFPGSPNYRDLHGWIEHEWDGAREVARERGLPAPESVRAIPFGGFEYLERMYALGDGRVLLWAKGLPPAWKGRLTRDAVAQVANSVPALFDRLDLQEDPRSASPDEYPRGLELVEAIDELRGVEPELAARLDALVRASVFDWRGVVNQGGYRGLERQQRAARLGLLAAALNDDSEMIGALVAGGFPLDGPVRGTSTALAVAIETGSTTVTEALLRSGQSLGDTVILRARELSVSRVDRLVSIGVGFDIEAVLSAGAAGALDTALRIFERGQRVGDWSDAAQQVRARAASNRSSAERIEAGTLSSYATPSDYRTWALRLEALADALG